MAATFGVTNLHGLAPATGHAQESSADSSIEVATLRGSLGVTVVAKPKKLITRSITLAWFTRPCLDSATASLSIEYLVFYDMKADGFSLDDKRSPQPGKSDLPDILQRWQNLAKEKSRKRTDQSFLVPKADITANNYDLSLNRYKEVVHEVVDHDTPKEILTRLTKLETEISHGQKDLEGLLI